MKSLLAAAALVFLSTTAEAQIEKPIRYTWIASSCSTWNCAAAALVAAGGDKYLIVMPTGLTDTPWIVLRRVEEGSIVIPDDEPFACEVFDDAAGASANFTAMETCRAPIMLSVADGRSIVAALHGCDGSGTSKRRAAH